jgi:serine/threonine-protein kinase
MQSARDNQGRQRAISRLTPTTPPALATAAFQMPFAAGEIIGGKYKVLDLVGTGGVAFVVSARHVALDEVVALKFLRPEFATHPEAVRRFTIEGRANFKIQSEHVVRVLDVDSLADGTPFIVMELLEGTDLGRVLESRGALPIEQAVSYALQACEGLATAHAAYVVHRDIKPENLFLTKNEQGVLRVKLLDFGISKVALGNLGNLEQSAPAHTIGTTILGSPPYMSPEQVRGSRETDARTDIWSLGCVLYELLANRAPFERPSVAETCAAILTDAPPSLRALAPHVPAELDAVVMRCLLKEPSARFQDVGQLANALLPFAQPPGTVRLGRRASDAAPEPAVAPAAPATTAAVDDADLGALHEFRRSDRSTRVQRALIAAALALALGGTYAAMQRSSMPAAQPAAADTSSASTVAANAAAPAPIAEPHIATPATPAPDEAAAPALEAPAEAAPAVAAAVTRAAPAAASAPKKPLKSKAPLRAAKPKPAEPDVGF